MDPALQAKLDSLADCERDLSALRPPNFESFQRDKMLRRYAERLLHIAIENCIQIGLLVLADSGFRTPENYHDIFGSLGEHHVIAPPLVNSMTSLVELRNLLVYEHEALEGTTVYGALKKRVDDMAEFGQAVRAYLEGQPAASTSGLELEAAELDELE